jgi:hypothetical protein
MEDVGLHLLPEGDAPISLEQHLGFMDAMASMHAAFWGWRDEFEMLPLSNRLLFFHPDQVRQEMARPAPAEVPVIALQGWALLRERAPRAEAALMRLFDDPGPLIEALESTPQTFIHGDWKMGNLGMHPDGRAIVLDWAIPGQAPATIELTWYLALNRRRLPQTKEATIGAYASALERHGVTRDSWWSKQLSLAFVVAMMWFGWEKAYDEDAELGWWEERLLDGLHWLS